MNEKNITELLNVLRAMAIEGLTYAQNEYDKARYEKLLSLSADSYSSITGIDTQKIQELFLKEMGSVTPKIRVEAAIFNGRNEILVLKRTDNHLWCLPCGWADVDEDAFQTAVRETLEETGLTVEPLGYAAVAQKGPKMGTSLVSQINIAVLCKDVPSDIPVTISHEHEGFRWVSEHEDVEWHPGHEAIKNRVFEARRTGTILPYTK